MRECLLQLSQAAIGVSDIILNIGILRVSRAASLSAAMAPFQLPAPNAFLPAAKSGSSCAQSATSAIEPIIEQIGQGSALPWAPGASSWATNGFCHSDPLNAQRANARRALRPRTHDSGWGLPSAPLRIR